MPVTVPSAVDVVSSIATGSALYVEHPETLILHALGQQRMERLRNRLEMTNASDDAWRAYDALHEEMTSVFPMVLEPCSDDLAAKRCEWYAKVLRATAK